MKRIVLIGLALACALLLACGDDGDGEMAAGSGSASGEGGSSGMYSAEELCPRPNPQGDPQAYASPYCGDCLCKRCPEVVPDCDQACWDLMVCMHNACDGNVDDLDACAAGACSEHAAGLDAAKAIAPCMYDPSDLGQGAGAERNSCIIACNFGVR